MIFNWFNLVNVNGVYVAMFGCMICVCARGWCVSYYMGMCVSIANGVFHFMHALCTARAFFMEFHYGHSLLFWGYMYRLTPSL